MVGNFATVVYYAQLKYSRSRINLEQVPHLCIFFLEFLLRSRTLPGLEPALRSALDVAKQALIELPLTGAISEFLPDDFSKGCKECWGQKTRVFREVKVDQAWLANFEETKKAEEEAEKVENETTTDQAEEVMELVDEGGWNAEDALGWGSTGGGWDTGEWGTGQDDAGANGNEEANQWEPPIESKPFLMRLLGPTVLPLTHDTGIVEHSFRRITKLIPVPTTALPKASGSPDDPYVADPAGVETLLERTFPQVVLSPWLNWDGGEWPGYAEPEILDSSNGPVVDPPYVKKEDSATATPAGTPKPHDPANDSITLLVHPSVFDKLLVGMALAGTWVQLVRKPADPNAPAPKKKSKAKKKAPANFWYVDELAGVFPSFWTTKST